MAIIKWQEVGGFLTLNNGKQLEYTCYGPAPDQAATLILLHEGLGCVALWRDFPEKLAKATGMGVFVYSRAGYGQSDASELPWPLDYMSREALEILPQIIDGLAIQNAMLVGHSDGASIASIYAGSLEDHRIRGLVLLAPHFFTEPMGLAEIAIAKVNFDEGDLKERMARYHKNPENCFRGWNDSWLHPDFEKWNVADSIDYLRIPVLAIQGREDQYGTQAQLKEIENRIYSPVDIEVIEDCKHSAHIEQPEKTLELIANFCARVQNFENVNVKVS